MACLLLFGAARGWALGHGGFASGVKNAPVVGRVAVKAPGVDYGIAGSVLLHKVHAAGQST